MPKTNVYIIYGVASSIMDIDWFIRTISTVTTGLKTHFLDWQVCTINTAYRERSMIVSCDHRSPTFKPKKGITKRKRILARGFLGVKSKRIFGFGC